jgi:hypothetical protein
MTFFVTFLTGRVNMMKYLSLFYLLSISSFIFITGCISKPVLENSEPLPQIVKEYRTVRIYGHIPGMHDTGVHLEKDDVYSMFGTGKINISPSNPDPNWSIVYPGHRTEARVGNNYAFPTAPTHFSGDLLMAPHSGNLYLGIMDGLNDRYGNPLEPKYFEDNLGSFIVDIIVWQREDWVQIANFYELLFKQNPDNPGIELAFNHAKARKKLYLAERRTSEQLVKVEKEIKELKKKSDESQKERIKTTPKEKILPVDKSHKLTTSEQERIINLEKKLAQLTATLAQLEDMKKKWEEERERSDLLAKELEEQQQKEQELLTKLEKSSKTPPVIVITSPKNDIASEIPFIILSGVAVDERGLKQLNIFINDRASDDQYLRGLKLAKMEYPKRFEFKKKIPLDKGANKIKIHAIDSGGLLTERILTVHRIERRRKIWAVVIGVNNYPHTRQLKYAVNDAKAFYQHLVDFTMIPPENILLLLNKDARLTRLRSTLGTYLKNKAGKEDMVIIYFAGHGATEKDVTSPDGDGLEKYLLPYDVDPKDLYATALPMGEISRIFTRIQSERLIFIADSCYSGASGGRTISLTGIRSNISDGFLDRIATGKGKIIMTASGANEVSEENENLRHGVFTYFLLEGLRGNADTDRDGLITVDEVYRYVSNRVPEATNNEQHPVKKGSVEGQLVLGFVE